jgi:hypothetical protein
MQLIQNKFSVIKNAEPTNRGSAYYNMYLFFDDLQQLHGTSFHTNTTCNALGNGITLFVDHDLHGTCFHTLTTTNAQLLVDHINTGLGILCNGTMLTHTHALATLDAGIRLSAVALGDNLNAGIVGMELLIKSLGASANTFQASHTFQILLNSKLFHLRKTPFFLIRISL